MTPSPRLSTVEFARRVLIVVAIVGCALVVWQMIDVVLLIFGGVILAVCLVSLSRVVTSYTHLSRGWALASVVGVLVVAVSGLGAWMGARLESQFGELEATLGSVWTQARHAHKLGAILDSASQSVPLASVSHLAERVAAGFAGAISGAALVVFVGLFLAADPRYYRHGVLRLVPAPGREQTAVVLDALGVALGRWLKGVVVAMLSVGAATTLGLWLLGIPLALALGILAGALEFIPYVGPIVSAIPAVLVAFSVGPWHALEAAGLFVAVHALEAYVLVPSIQKWAVALPPALGIIAVVIFGILFGPIGIILAHPLMVCAMVAVEELYLRRGPRVVSSQVTR